MSIINVASNHGLVALINLFTAPPMATSRSLNPRLPGHERGGHLFTRFLAAY
ncbi:MAG: hypothetical protein IPL78_22750 [Chloroflexi bacterium]|nr:hypothetical protein [Chloroflexota bacterium]